MEDRVQVEDALVHECLDREASEVALAGSEALAEEVQAEVSAASEVVTPEAVEQAANGK